MLRRHFVTCRFLSIVVFCKKNVFVVQHLKHCEKLNRVMDPNIKRYLIDAATELKSTQKQRELIKALELFIQSTKEAAELKTLKIQDFKILEIIGQGGYGKVYKARIGNQEVAVKQINLDKCFPHMVLAEKNCMVQLHHRAIVKLLCSWHEIDAFLVLELCLGDLWSFSNKLSELNIFRFVIQILEGVEHMHALGIIHRDLKPENLLITSSNNIKIADFGLAIQLKPEEESFTSTNIFGTYHYLPLEALKDQIYSRKSDMFMIGAIIFELDTRSPLLLQRVKEAFKNGPGDFIQSLQMGRKKECLENTVWQYIKDQNGGYLREPIEDRLKKSRYKTVLSPLLNASPANRLSATELLNHPFLTHRMKKFNCRIYDDQSQMVVNVDDIPKRKPFLTEDFRFVTKKNWNITKFCLLSLQYVKDLTLEKMTNTTQTTVKNQSTKAVLFNKARRVEAKENDSGSSFEVHSSVVQSKQLDKNSCKSSLESNLKNTTSVMKFFCNICGLHCATKNSLRRHRDSHMITFQCKKCRHVYKNKKFLRAHYKKDH